MLFFDLFILKLNLQSTFNLLNYYYKFKVNFNKYKYIYIIIIKIKIRMTSIFSLVIIINIYKFILLIIH